MQSKLFAIILEKRFIFATVSITLVTGILVTANSYFDILQNKDILVGSIFITFLVSISLVFLQILIGVIVNNSLIMSLSNSKSGIRMPTEFSAIETSLNVIINDIINDKRQEISLKIICYGTSGYSGVIERIWAKNNKNKDGGSKIDTVIYNPKTRVHFNSDDKSAITQLIEKATSGKINFYAAEILPTMRACVIYDKNNAPIWCCLQSYCYFGRFGTVDYEMAPALFADENDPNLLKNLENIIIDEYKRLGGE